MLVRTKAMALDVSFAAALPFIATCALHLQTWHALSAFNQEKVLPLVVAVGCVRGAGPNMALAVTCALVITAHHVRLAEDAGAARAPDAVTLPGTRRGQALLAAAAVPCAYPFVVAFELVVAAVLGRVTLGLPASAYARGVLLEDPVYGFVVSLLSSPVAAVLSLWGAKLWGTPLPLVVKLICGHGLLVVASFLVSWVAG